MKRIELEESLSQIWSKSRSASGLSQEAIAKKLNVSKKTVQNWEAGDSFPSFIKAVEWFSVLGVPMYPYVMDALYPTEMQAIKSNDPKAIKDALHVLIDELDDLRAMELLFCLRGGHGSSPTGSLDLCTTYLSLPLPMRVTLASATLLDYEIAKSSGNLKEDHASPSIETVKRCIETAKLAVINGKSSYIFEEEK